MIKLSKKVEYALIALNYMSRKSGKELTTAREISVEFDISLELMGKILQNLVKHGMVISVQGIKGGYYLARSAGDVRLSAVITAIDGPIKLTDCSSKDSSYQCKRERRCNIKQAVAEIQIQLIELFSRITLKDFQRSQPSTVHDS